MKIDASELFDLKTLVIFDVENVAKLDYVGNYMRFKGGKPAFGFNTGKKEHNSTVIQGILARIVHLNYYIDNVDFISSFDTKEGFLRYINSLSVDKAFDGKHEMYNQITSLRHAFKGMGVKVLEEDGMESSSLIFKAVKNNYDKYEQILIYTRDKVLYDLVDEKVSIVQPSSKQDLTYDNFEEVTGVPLGMYNYKLIMLGDSTITSINSLNQKVTLKGVKGVGPAKFQKLLFSYDTNKSMLENIKETSLLNEEQKNEAIGIYAWLQPSLTKADTIPSVLDSTSLKTYLEYYGCNNLIERVI